MRRESQRAQCSERVEFMTRTQSHWRHKLRVLLLMLWVQLQMTDETKATHHQLNLYQLQNNKTTD